MVCVKVNNKKIMSFASVVIDVMFPLWRRLYVRDKTWQTWRERSESCQRSIKSFLHWRTKMISNISTHHGLTLSTQTDSDIQVVVQRHTETDTERHRQRDTIGTRKDILVQKHFYKTSSLNNYLYNC